ncbi:hypothetical protein CYLTODRAFT_444519 [Cylindrobasidium torrendii FP15055 ss-10]|uniref:Uncharacterized protein n=1 Tax=Cylindrobasidium torrendii FP15055 ss-10 TaxID=1314674 RepID=A0A0D7B8Z5_9AGAR|nr:hypothetical protein CYLTODRAFT_444519 [Cylindrobasidium torrendii FP15055 ss-10]
MASGAGSMRDAPYRQSSALPRKYVYANSLSAPQLPEDFARPDSTPRTLWASPMLLSNTRSTIGTYQEISLCKEAQWDIGDWSTATLLQLCSYSTSVTPHSPRRVIASALARRLGVLAKVDGADYHTGSFLNYWIHAACRVPHARQLNPSSFVVRRALRLKLEA